MVEGVKRAHAENPKKLLLEAKDLLESIKEILRIPNRIFFHKSKNIFFLNFFEFFGIRLLGIVDRQ